MKEITLQVEDEHYEIFERLAKDYGAPVGEYVLTAAKCAVSARLDAEDYVDDGPYSFLFDKRLGGTD